MLKEDVALVTGGASGLGLAIATLLQFHGVQVIIFDKNKEALEKLPDTFFKYSVDVTDKLSVTEALDDVMMKHQKITVLINNAGVIYSAPLINIMNKEDRVHNYEIYKNIIDINMHSVFLMGSLVAEKMIMNRVRGVIINISSVCARGNAGQSAYSAAKAGVDAFTKSWAKELGSFGIRVISVAPGFIDTLSTHSALDASIIDDLKKKIPLRRLGQDKNVADLVFSVIKNDYMSGAILDVNGGFSL